MSLIDALSAASDLKKTADFARWMSTLRLVGAGLVALGVVFEFVGEMAGRRSEHLLQASHEVQIEKLAERIELLRNLTALTQSSFVEDRTVSEAVDQKFSHGISSQSPSCPRQNKGTML